LQSQLLGRWRQEEHEFEASLGIGKTLCQSQNTNKRTERVSQMVESLYTQGPEFNPQYWGKKRKEEILYVKFGRSIHMMLQIGQ
jgi:hypothetical protein